MCPHTLFNVSITHLRELSTQPSITGSMHLIILQNPTSYDREQLITEGKVFHDRLPLPCPITGKMSCLFKKCSGTCILCSANLCRCITCFANRHTSQIYWSTSSTQQTCWPWSRQAGVVLGNIFGASLVFPLYFMRGVVLQRCVGLRQCK